MKMFSTKSLIISIAILLVLVSGGIGITLAFLNVSSNSIDNHFNTTASSVSVYEEFDGTVKKNVSAKNTCSFPAYLRIKLISYRVNDTDRPIGGESSVPTFTPGEGWLSLGEDTYVYFLPVLPNESPIVSLIGSDGITLKQYDDDEGGKQMIQVIAECIQATPINAVESAWGVTVADDGSLTLGD